MAVVGEAKSLVDLLLTGVDWVRNKRNPFRLQAQRLLLAFESHGIKRQQIPRLLPAGLMSSASIFADADKLRDSVSPQLLDWAADYLAVNRSWLDGTNDQPHQLVEHYKDEAKYLDWFDERRQTGSSANRTLYVLAEADLNVRPQGLVELLYAEHGSGLDGNELSRYWRLSSEWPAQHVPCLESTLEVLKHAKAAGVLVIGRVVERRALNEFVQGKTFGDQVTSRSRASWYPEDMTPRWT
jgi:hypothetical protein